jgi:hypothetical protein
MRSHVRRPKRKHLTMLGRETRCEKSPGASAMNVVSMCVCSGAFHWLAWMEQQVARGKATEALNTPSSSTAKASLVFFSFLALLTDTPLPVRSRGGCVCDEGRVARLACKREIDERTRGEEGAQKP